MSKGLEALKRMYEHLDVELNEDDYAYKIADKDFETIKKELKALEIIKEKEINVFIFLHSGDLETYNDMVEDNRKLTQEEFDLLKEVLL